MHVQCDGWFVAVVVVRLCCFGCDVVVCCCLLFGACCKHHPCFCCAHRFSFRVLARFGVGWHRKRAGSWPKARSWPFFASAGRRKQAFFLMSRQIFKSLLARGWQAFWPKKSNDEQIYSLTSSAPRGSALHGQKNERKMAKTSEFPADLLGQSILKTFRIAWTCGRVVKALD